MSVKEKLPQKNEPNQLIELSQGDWVQLTNQDKLFQVIGIDLEHQKCWVRQWPLMPKGTPVIEISMKEIVNICLAKELVPTK